MSTPPRYEDVAGSRFAFGENWKVFLDVLDHGRIFEAERSLTEISGGVDFKGVRFLDAGSGSGLFSLAARRLGAKVYSFDCDSESVECTRELKRRYFSDDPDWVVEKGSVLDRDYIHSLGTFDFVYSWGVLHHTGAMWVALENAMQLVTDGGRLYISIYNDQGWKSRCWTSIKRTYNRMPPAARWLLLLPSLAVLWGPTTVRDLLCGEPFHSWRNYGGVRGMDPWRDLVDWVGGYPFEVAKPEEIFNFYQTHGFTLVGLKTVGGGLGCNEFVFLRRAG